MKKIVNALSLVAVLFCANGALAEKVCTETETIKAGPCVHLRTPSRCTNYPTGECFWDYADQRCENRSNSEDSCSRIRSRYACINSQYGCFWDYDDQRCERQD